MKVFVKQPLDYRDYDIDLTEWLPDGDTVISVDVTVPDGIDLAATTIQSPIVKLWIRGGTSGEEYKFTALINTVSRTKEVDFYMVVRDF